MSLYGEEMSQYEVAEKLLKSGELVALPTDTVYGIAACALNTCSIRKLYQLKNRPISNPLTINLADIDDLKKYLLTENKLALALANKFWPGALTIVVKVNKGKIPSLIRSGGDYCGFRIADLIPLRELIRKVGPIVLPSANLSGEPPLENAEMIKKIFPDLYVVEAESKGSQIPSTVVQVDKKVSILREGAVSLSMIEEVINKLSPVDLCSHR